jgi:hypothetical protein
MVRWDLREDAAAVEGFMTDLPALMIVIIAVTVFMVTAASSIDLTSRAGSEARATRGSERLLDAFCNYGPVRMNGSLGYGDGPEGQFSDEKLTAVSGEDGAATLLVDELRIPRGVSIVVEQFNGTDKGTNARISVRVWRFGPEELDGGAGGGEGGTIMASRPALISDSGAGKDAHGRPVLLAGEVRVVRR